VTATLPPPVADPQIAGREPKRVPYVPALDGLRALAVIAVLLYHADLGWIPGGFLGVEVFFVISGYLITLLLVSEHEQNGRISLRTFWFRRARRLLPAAYTLLLVVSLTVVLFVREQAEQTRGDVIAGLTYTTNWYLIGTGQSYFQSFGRPSLLRHLWSLAVEEQFYLLWPLILILLLVVCRRRPERMAIPMLAMVAASTVLMAVLYSPADPSRAYYGTDTRAGGLILGATLALFWRPGYLRRGAVAARGRIFDLVGLAGLGALAVIMATIGDQDAVLYRGGFLMVGVATLACIAMATHPKSIVAKALALRPIVWVGTRSYAIYLWHWPVYCLTRPGIDVPWSPGPTLLFRLVVTGVLAELSYRLVEGPIRHGAIRQWATKLYRSKGADRQRRLRTTRWVAGTLSVAIVVSVVGLADAKPHAGAVEQSIKAGQSALTSQTSVAAAPPDATGSTTVAATAATPTTVAGAPDPATAPTTVPTTAAPPTTVSAAIHTIAIGDSVMLGAAPQLKDVLGPDSYIDAHVGRQFKEATSMIDWFAANGKLGQVVVVHLGNNGTVSADTVDDVLDRLGNVPKVIVVNVRVNREWQDSVDATLAARVPAHPNAVLLDWFAASDGHPEYFYDDGTHLRPAGAAQYAALIKSVAG
jgi:peptidoglycan/LPS O-acetylase OafA/YrhL/lysophospholipase L1-like esterase